ncbi:MAG: PepSY domain-containing protein [Turicibacter sp.]|nr:PepSY domain-containing protein [Turicibacter sp.]
MKKEIIICAASVVATLGVTKLPDLLSHVTVITQPTTETVQETTKNETDDKTNELLEQILVKLDGEEVNTEKETVDDSKTESNSTTNSSSTQASTAQATTKPASSQQTATAAAKPASSQQTATAAAKPASSQQTATAAAKPASSQQTATASSKIKTTVARAKEIAVARVGGGTITEFSQDFDDRVPNYDVTIRHGNAEYDLEISAVDGSILAFDVEYDKVVQKPSNSTSSSNIKITAAKAKEIAIAQAGGGTVTDFSQDFDERVPKYEVKVRNGNTEYDFDISAVDGSILSREVDHENDRDDHDDWD